MLGRKEEENALSNELRGVNSINTKGTFYIGDSYNGTINNKNFIIE